MDDIECSAKVKFIITFTLYSVVVTIIIKFGKIINGI